MNKDQGKRDFISFYQKLHNLDPGPKYEIGLDMSKKHPTNENTKIYKISPSKIPSFLAATEKLSAQTPGPGRYEPSRKRKILGNFKLTGHKSEFYEESVWKGKATPHPYDSVNIEKYKMNRTQEWKFPRPIKEEPTTIKKDNSPSPTTYLIEKQTNASSLHPKPIQYTLNKAKKQCFVDVEVANRKVSPGAGQYRPERADPYITLGARKGYK